MPMDGCSAAYWIAAAIGVLAWALLLLQSGRIITANWFNTQTFLMLMGIAVVIGLSATASGCY